jgi:hypothetical protein
METILELIKKILFFDLFPFLCRLIASILLLLGFYSVGFPPVKDISSSSAFLLVLALFVLLLPIAKKLVLEKS